MDFVTVEKPEPQNTTNEDKNLSVISQAKHNRSVLESWVQDTLTKFMPSVHREASLSNEQKKQIREYWDYYNKEYADALVKDF